MREWRPRDGGQRHFIFRSHGGLEIYKSESSIKIEINFSLTVTAEHRCISQAVLQRASFS